MGTLAYQQVIEAIRSRFTPEQAEIWREIYEPNDDEAMKMIALDTQGVVGFNAFFQAAAAAYAAALRSGATISERELWDELLGKLKADPRWTNEP